MRFWWFIEEEEQEEMCCCYFGLSQFEIGMFRICRKKIAELEAGKAELARLQRTQEATLSSVSVWLSLAVLFPGRI